MSYVTGAWPSTDVPMWCGEWLNKLSVGGSLAPQFQANGQPWNHTPGAVNLVDL